MKTTHQNAEITMPNLSNYRGITITGAIGKLFNSVLNVRLDNYLQKYSLIDKTQIGFTKHSRTSDHMFILKCLIDKYISIKGGNLYTCFIDFQKAFDSVIHEGIKYKLLKIGVGSKFYNIIKNMYSKSRSCIKVKTGLTNYIDLNLGVRQGDNLSPNLFKIFINDLPKYLEETIDPVNIGDLTLNCLMYADDVVILSTSKTGLQEKLKKLEKFCSDWCLQVNINKSKVIVFNKSGTTSKDEFFFENTKLENVHDYKYLGLQFSASGSFSLARKNLYNKALKAYFKLVKDILSFQPSVKTSIHVFDHTVKPILLYGSEIWGALNPSSPRLRNNVSMDKIYKDIEPDKLNTKFCKLVLGVNRKSSNFAVFAELGRHPFYLDIVKNVLLFWHRVENMPSDTLLYNALKCSKDVDKKACSWYSSIKQLCSILDIKLESSSQSKFKFKNILKKTINKLFLNEWYTTRQDYCSGKLDTYCKLKTHFGCEKYINEIRNFSYRRSITRFRISAHRLKIETGRYIKLDRSERLCTKCSTGAIEDEQHFLMECSKFNAFRNSFFQIINDSNRNFMELDSFQKFFWILTNENSDILHKLGQYLHEHLD